VIGMSLGAIAEYQLPDWSSAIRVFSSAIAAMSGGRLFDYFWPKPKPGWQ
jgi:hypothetical protein